MGEFIAFCIGFIIGGMFGVLVMAFVVGGKMSKEREIEEAIERIENGSRGGEE